jgi:hypothetical protein
MEIMDKIINERTKVFVTKRCWTKGCKNTVMVRQHTEHKKCFECEG